MLLSRDAFVVWYSPCGETDSNIHTVQLTQNQALYVCQYIRTFLRVHASYKNNSPNGGVEHVVFFISHANSTLTEFNANCTLIKNYAIDKQVQNQN